MRRPHPSIWENMTPLEKIIWSAANTTDEYHSRLLQALEKRKHDFTRKVVPSGN